MNILEIEIEHSFDSGFRLQTSFATDSLVTSLFGPSGSGKSSVLNIIAGLLTPRKGWVRNDGRELLNTKSRVCVPPEKRDIGFVFQDHQLFPHLNVRANLMYGWNLRSAARSDITFEKVVDVLQLEPHLAQMPHTLSGGQKQRVALGRALLRNPKLLLMDEPLTGLDEALKSRVLGYLERAVTEWGIPTLYVSHNLFEVQRLAQWVVVVEEGKVIDEGATHEVLTHASQWEHGESTAMVNLLRVHDVEKSADDIWVGKVGRQPISLPSLDQSSDPLLISFPASSVGLSRVNSTSGTSIRNQLKGQITQLLCLKDRVLVQLDVGQPLWAEITVHAQRELKLEVGMSINALVKTMSMRPVW